jgi:UDP-GlcNAc3NAcA epimerase
VSRKLRQSHEEFLLHTGQHYDYLMSGVFFDGLQHPRTRKAVAEIEFKPKANVRLIDPIGYLETIELVSSARMVLTDSGGLHKEAYWLGVPCLTMRNETEWIETVNEGWNPLVGADKEKIIGAVNSFSPPDLRRPLYGLGAAEEKCVEPIGSQSVVFTRTVGPTNAR